MGPAAKQESRSWGHKTSIMSTNWLSQLHPGALAPRPFEILPRWWFSGVLYGEAERKRKKWRRGGGLIMSGNDRTREEQQCLCVCACVCKHVMWPDVHLKEKEKKKEKSILSFWPASGGYTGVKPRLFIRHFRPNRRDWEKKHERVKGRGRKKRKEKHTWMFTKSLWGEAVSLCVMIYALSVLWWTLTTQVGSKNFEVRLEHFQCMIFF